MERQIEFVLRLERTLHLGEYRFLTVEWTTGCGAHQKKRRVITTKMTGIA